MKSLGEVVEYVVGEINSVYQRPKMYAVEASGVMAVLSVYHRVWAEVTDRHAEFASALKQVLDAEQCGPYYFDRHYKLRLTIQNDFAEDAAIEYVIEQYRRVDAILGIALLET